MKKIVSICMLVITILSYLVVITINQSADYEQLMRMGETQNSFKIYVQGSHSTPSDEVEFFNYLAKKYHVSFILTTTGQNNTINKSVTYDSKSFPASSFRLNKVNFDNKKNFYASYRSNSNYQKGVIPTFFKKSRIKLQTLDSFFNKDRQNVDGTYTVVLSSPADKQAVLKQLASYYGTSETKLLIILQSNMLQKMFIFFHLQS